MSTWEWYRTFFEDGRSEAELALDYATLGFLRELRDTMIERMLPVNEDALKRMTRQRGINKRTLEKMVSTLVEADLIYVTDSGFWCDVAERETQHREEKSRNISKRNGNVSRKRWGKNQQNQCKSIPEKEGEIREGKTPSGSYPSSNNTDNNISYARVRALEERSGSDASYDPYSDFDPVPLEGWDPGEPPEREAPTLKVAQPNGSTVDDTQQRNVGSSPQRRHKQRVEKAMRDASFDPAIAPALLTSLEAMPLGTDFSKDIVKAAIDNINRGRRNERSTA
ncbi:hypothetical protein [Gellertiella hungarica]|uniref:Uncharacterized protein n=1 Tax=Gellertiella hungarica TaxID=1572859 RepID=A0A7W6NJT1_9HYPH|nr:hypothetical protein [Gellertiella hungarica]MBB4064745.1 hypothetical protein [Gellertiella hungarica]